MSVNFQTPSIPNLSSFFIILAVISSLPAEFPFLNLFTLNSNSALLSLFEKKKELALLVTADHTYIYFIQPSCIRLIHFLPRRLSTVTSTLIHLPSTVFICLILLCYIHLSTFMLFSLYIFIHVTKSLSSLSTHSLTFFFLFHGALASLFPYFLFKYIFIPSTEPRSSLTL